MTDGPFAWLMVIAALLLIFGGGKKLPEIGRGLGGFIREFKRAQKPEDGAADAKPIDAASEPAKLESQADDRPKA